jgi:hypothetical protein
MKKKKVFTAFARFCERKLLARQVQCALCGVYAPFERSVFSVTVHRAGAQVAPKQSELYENSVRGYSLCNRARRLRDGNRDNHRPKLCWQYGCLGQWVRQPPDG